MASTAEQDRMFAEVVAAALWPRMEIGQPIRTDKDATEANIGVRDLRPENAEQPAVVLICAPMAFPNDELQAFPVVQTMTAGDLDLFVEERDVFVGRASESFKPSHACGEFGDGRRRHPSSIERS